MSAPDRSLTLVTGASGFLGPHVVAAAVARNRADATFRDPLGPPVVAQARGPSLLVPRFTTPRDAADWIERDLLEDVEAWLDELAPTQVVHTAALSRAADCERAPELADAMNAELPRRIAAWCAEHGARLVHVSTDLVFGEVDAPSGGFDEATGPAPLSEYGRSKARGEELVLEACPAAVVARLPLLYGNSGGRGAGASDSLLEAVERGDRPRLFVDEWRTPLEVSQAGRALVELLEVEHTGVVHVAGADRVSRFELGLAVLRAMGLADAAARAEIDATRQADLDAGAPRPRDVSLATGLARRLLETELTGLRDGLARALGPG